MLVARGANLGGRDTWHGNVVDMVAGSGIGISTADGQMVVSNTGLQQVITLEPSGGDDLALVSEAIADAADGSHLYLKAGVFLLSGQLPQRKDIRLAISGVPGDANGSPTYLQFTHATSAPCVLLDGTDRSQSGVTGATLTMRDLTIVAPATSDAGFKVYNWARWSIFNVHVRGGNDAFLFDQAFIGTLWGCKAENAARDGLHGAGNLIRGYGCQFVHNARRGLWLSGVANHFSDVDLTRNGHDAGYGLGRSAVYLAGQQNRVDGYFETGDDGAPLICEFESGSLYNDASDVWGLGSFKDKGTGNRKPQAEGVSSQ